MNAEFSPAHLLKGILHKDIGLMPFIEGLGKDYYYMNEWAEVRIDLGLQVAGQKAEAFAGFDGRAPGQAPQGLQSTGSAAFNVLWSLTGVPAITLPLLNGADGLPVGVQLIGPRGDDGRLLRSARWLVKTLTEMN